MARMYSGKKGKSGSKKPIKKVKPSWLSYKPKEIEMLVVKLSKEGKSASQIGLYLRDAYGIADVRSILGKKVTQILEAKKILPKIPEDLNSLIKKQIYVTKHLEMNPKDEVAKRGLKLTESKINKLIQYYKKANRLDPDWKYDPKMAGLFLEQ